MTKKIDNIFFYILLFVLCFAFCIQTNVVDVDLFSRLIQGKHVVQTGSVMYQDIVSFAKTHTWYDHEWLSSAIFYLVLEKLHPLGLTIFKCFLCFMVFVLVDLNIIVKTKKTNYSYRYLYIFIFCLFMHHMKLFAYLRSQDFTFIFYPLLILLLEYTRNKQNSKLFYIIPFFMLLWFNMHGGSMYSLGIIFLYGAGEFLNKKPYKKYFLILIPSILVYFINPWGVDFVNFLFNSIGVDRRWVGEWQTPLSMKPELVVIYLVQLVSICFIYLFGLIKNKFRNLDYTKVLVCFASLVLALRYIKFNPMFFITVFIFLYEDFKTIVDFFVKNIKIKLAIKYSAIIAAIIFSINIFSNNSILNSWYYQSADEFPIRPMQFLIDNDIKGRILAPYYLSGFIAYKNYPDYIIYMDGRQEQVYDYETFDKEMRFLFFSDESAFRILNEDKPEIILIENYWHVNGYLLYDQDYYKRVYQDEKYSIYLVPDKQLFSYQRKNETPYYTRESFFDTKIDFSKKQ